MKRLWLAILLLVSLVAAESQDHPVLLGAHRAGRVEVFDADTLQPLGSVVVLPNADRISSASNGILFLRQGLPPDYKGCCALYAFDLKTRNMTRLLQPVLGITVSPDGQHVVTQRGNIGIEVFDAHTLRPETSIPRSTAPGIYGLSFSPDGQLLFGTSNFPSRAVDIFSFKDRRLVGRFALPEGFTIRGAWVGDAYYVYGYRKAGGELWRVKADGSELETRAQIDLPHAAPECQLYDLGVLAAGRRLLVFEQFGGKGDRRGRSKDVPGGAFLVDPQTGKQMAHLVPELHFAQLIPSADGKELYGIDVGNMNWSSVSLVRLNAETGEVLARRELSPDVWSFDLANLSQELLLSSATQARASK